MTMKILEHSNDWSSEICEYVVEVGEQKHVIKESNGHYETAMAATKEQLDQLIADYWKQQL